MQLITPKQAEEIRQALARIPGQRGLGPEASLDFFLRMYIRPAKKYLDISQSVLLDCACGTSFLAHAYILAGGKQAIAVDLNRSRVEVSYDIGKALGIQNRVQYLQGSITELPFGGKSVDVLASIETLEHVGKKRYKAITEINRITKQLVILTTPNLWAPVIPHDTGLPLAHWMPASLRRIYAELFKRQHENSNNLFVSPLRLKSHMRDFRRVSRVLTFDTFQEWVNVHPYYLPYGGHRRSGGEGACVSLKQGRWGTMKYYNLYFISLAWPLAYYFSHNLAGLYLKRQ